MYIQSHWWTTFAQIEEKEMLKNKIKRKTLHKCSIKTVQRTFFRSQLNAIIYILFILCNGISLIFNGKSNLLLNFLC